MFGYLGVLLIKLIFFQELVLGSLYLRIMFGESILIYCHLLGMEKSNARTVAPPHDLVGLLARGWWATAARILFSFSFITSLKCYNFVEVSIFNSICTIIFL